MSFLSKSHFFQTVFARQDHDSLAHNKLDEGRRLRRAGRLDDAAQALFDAVTVRPGFLEARLLLGVTLLELGQIERAVSELAQAAALDRRQAAPHLSRALAQQAVHWQRRGKRRAARSAAQQALDLDPGNRLARRILDQL